MKGMQTLSIFEEILGYTWGVHVLYWAIHSSDDPKSSDLGRVWVDELLMLLNICCFLLFPVSLLFLLFLVVCSSCLLFARCYSSSFWLSSLVFFVCCLNLWCSRVIILGEQPEITLLHSRIKMCNGFQIFQRFGSFGTSTGTCIYGCKKDSESTMRRWWWWQRIQLGTHKFPHYLFCIDTISRLDCFAGFFIHRHHTIFFARISHHQTHYNYTVCPKW